jgi:hypothetical protein
MGSPAKVEMYPVDMENGDVPAYKKLTLVVLLLVECIISSLPRGLMLMSWLK